MPSSLMNYDFFFITRLCVRREDGQKFNEDLSCHCGPTSGFSVCLGGYLLWDRYAICYAMAHRLGLKLQCWHLQVYPGDGNTAIRKETLRQ